MAKIWAVDLLRSDLPAARPAPGAVLVAEVSAASMPSLRAAMGGDGDLVDLRLGRGCRAFVAVAGGEVVAFGWLSIGPEWIGELGLQIRPPAGDGYIWNCVTLAEHRHRGYFRALLEHVVATARAQGLRRLWIGAIDGGAESAVTGTGFAPALQVRTLTLGMVRRLAVDQEGVEPALLDAALSVLGDGQRPLRSSLLRVRRRRH